MNKLGRPKKEEANNIIKVAVNNETAETFELTAKAIGKSKSDLLREIIPTISSKDYEGMIPNTSLDLLQKYSNDCWELIHTNGCLFEVDKLSERMPAYITIGNPSMINVKYPTYKLQIFSKESPLNNIDTGKLQNLVDNVSNISKVYLSYEKYIIIKDDIVELPHPFVNEITCLSTNLEENTNTKNELSTLLKDNGFIYSVYPTFCIRSDYIELIEDNKYFKIKTNEKEKS